MNEAQTVALLNASVNLGLVSATDPFSPFDAEGANYIVEIKNRREYYPEKMIEAYKLFANYQQAQIKGKQFLYVVTDSKGVWVYNLSKSIDSVLERSCVPMSCPMTTDFDRNGKITKYVYTLPETLAKKLNE